MIRQLHVYLVKPFPKLRALFFYPSNSSLALSRIYASPPVAENRQCPSSDVEGCLLLVPIREEVRYSIRGEWGTGRNDGDESALQRRFLDDCNDAHACARERNAQKDVSAAGQRCVHDNWRMEEEDLQPMIVDTPTLEHKVRHAEKEARPKHPTKISFRFPKTSSSPKICAEYRALTSTTSSGQRPGHFALSATVRSKCP